MGRGCKDGERVVLSVAFVVLMLCYWFGMATEILKKVGERVFENHPPHPK